MSGYRRTRECNSARSPLARVTHAHDLNAGPMGSSHTHHPCDLDCSLSHPPTSWRGNPPQLLPHLTSSCIHFKEPTVFYGEEKVPTCRKDTPRGGSNRGSLSTCWKNTSTEWLVEDVRCEHEAGASSPWPHHPEFSPVSSSRRPRTGGHRTHTHRGIAQTHAHTGGSQGRRGARAREGTPWWFAGAPPLGMDLMSSVSK